MVRRTFVASALAAVVCRGRGVAAHAKGIGIQVINTPADTQWINPAALNDHGRVVGEIAHNLIAQAFLWDGGVAQDLGMLPGHARSLARGINNRGDIVGWSSEDPYGREKNRAVLWSNGKIYDLGVLPGHAQSFATAINDPGEVVGYSAPAGGSPHAVIWRNGRITDLGTPPWSTYSEGSAINNRGQVAGRGGLRAFRWTDGEFVDLGILPGDNLFVEAHGMNDPGEVVGLVAPPSGITTTAFRWDGETMTALPGLPGSFVGIGMGINNSGVIAGRVDVGNPFVRTSHAVIWTREGKLTDLGTGIAYAINNRSEVVGLTGTGEAVVWKPPER